jgi:hypothetical protein
MMWQHHCCVTLWILVSAFHDRAQEEVSDTTVLLKRMGCGGCRS